MNRRTFLQNASIASFGALILPQSLFAYNHQSKKVRVGLIGVGMRGQVHLNELLKREDVEVVALAEPDSRMIERCNKIFERNNKKPVQYFSKGEYDYRNLLKIKNLDAVVISTPWEWHEIQTLESMKAGKIVGLEVCGALNLEECWKYVDCYEETKVPIFMMENVCYRRDILSVFNMVRKGKFGTIVHGQGGTNMI